MGDKREDAKSMECRRCGVCCTVHQAFVTGEDMERITAYLVINKDEWLREYDDPRWRYSQYRLIRHVNGACAFLRHEDGLAACSIQPVKPKCCQDWRPGPDRKECLEGRKKAAAGYGR